MCVPIRCTSMDMYKIRILNPDLSTDLVIAMPHASDHAAIRSARRIAGARGVEVWRDLDCVLPPPRRNGTALKLVG